MSDNPYSNPLWWIPGYKPPTQPKKKIVSYVPPAGRSTVKYNNPLSWFGNFLKGGTYGLNLYGNYGQPVKYKPRPLVSPFPAVEGSTREKTYTTHYAPYSAYERQQRESGYGYTGPLLNFQNPDMKLGADGKAVRVYRDAAEAGLPPGGVPGIPEHYWNPYLDPVLGDGNYLMQKWQDAQLSTRGAQAPRSSGYGGYGGYGYGGGYGGGGGYGSYKKEPNMARWYSELINWRI